MRLFFAAGQIVRRRRWRKLAASGALGDFDFFDELIGNGVEMAGGGVLRLGDKIDGAQGQSFERGVGAFLRMSAEQNHRQRARSA